MQAFYAQAFAREMGLAEPEFCRCLSEAWAPHAVTLLNTGDSARKPSSSPNQAQVQLASGVAHVTWRALEPRVIALATLPRLWVEFDFAGIEESERQRTMKRFDLVMLRGGG